VSKFHFLKTGCIAFLFCAAAAVTSSAQTLSTLVNFSGSNGVNPTAPVIQATDNNFYGTTNQGGANAAGTVFKMTPNGTLTTLYSFCSQANCADGSFPSAGLIQATDGNFYGTTSDGGAHGAGGTVFKITPGGTLTTLYSFCTLTQCADGQRPNAELLQGTDGNFYGTTATDGVNSAGTVFQLTPSGTLTTVYHFCAQNGCTDGATPNEVIQTSDGTLYGTTLYGGVGTTVGTVFKLTTSGALTTLWSFCTQSHCTDGQNPLAGLVLGSDGLFYGTTSTGGANGFGTVFKITSSGTFTLLHGFQQASDGTQSYGPLIQAADGNYYGTTRIGGSHSSGTIFQVTPTGALTVLYNFCSQTNCTDGGQSLAALKATRGNLYGTTTEGGSGGDGTIFSLLAPAPSPVQFAPVTPCRLLDTRSQNGGGPIQGGTFQTYNLPQLAQGAGCASLSTAKTYSLNVTLVPVDHGPVSYLTIWPAGQSQPVVSLMNSLDGRIKANAAIVPAGTSGGVSIYVTNTTNVVVDIDGFFATAGGSTLQFYPLPPCRVADTRSSNFPQGLGTPHLSRAVARDFPVLSSPCIPQNVNAAAYSFNFTAIPYPSLGNPLAYLEVWPTGAQPANPVSTLNNPTGTNVANAAIVPAGSSGEITAYPSDDTDLAIDINGYFAAPGTGGLSLYPAIPCRVYDSRTVGSGQPFTGTLSPPVDVIDGRCGVPDRAKAYVFNATVVPSPTLGYLTLWPDGADQPVVSTLNAGDGWITSNMAIVPTTNGDIDAYAAGMTQLILDISAYFAP
jgi:uncharacterized repeat protein (TIGR03803 family)